jgi:hypothetical protein
MEIPVQAVPHPHCARRDTVPGTLAIEATDAHVGFIFCPHGQLRDAHLFHDHATHPLLVWVCYVC